MNLLEFINNKTNNAYKDFKLVSVIFEESTRNCTFKFMYKDDMKSTDKDNLVKLIEEYVQEDVNIIVKCKKAYVDIDLVKDIIVNYIGRNYNSVIIGFDKDNIDVNIDSGINITINCDHFQYGLLNSIQNKQEMLEYVQNFFFEPCSIEMEENQTSTIDSADIINEAFIEDLDSPSTTKYIRVDKISNYVGEVVGAPIQIDCINGTMQDIEIAGTIRFFTEKSFESKRKNSDGENTLRTYYSFTIVDKTGRMNCVVFPNKSDMVKVSKLADDMVVIVHGDVEEYNGRINFKVKHIGKCEIIESDEHDEPQIPIKTEPNKNYLCCNPEPYMEMYQDNLFLQHDTVGQYLLDNDVVVFDVETTGLDATRCEILEIGAVKLHGGKITETFETLIKPSTPVPDEITELTGITDEMVKDSPSIRLALPDFYKFAYGCTIIAYNIDFDYKFISVQGKKLGYIFDNKQIDAMYLARAYIPGLKNFKLSTVCKHLGVSLVNAHRAVNDALATAECVIKLSPNIS